MAGVYKIGIYGVLIGTIVALLYRTNDIIIYANWNILGRKPWKTYRRWLQNMAVMFVCVIVVNYILPPMENYFVWVKNAIWVTLLCCGAYFAVDSIFDRPSFKMAKGIASGAIKKKLGKG